MPGTGFRLPAVADLHHAGVESHALIRLLLDAEVEDDAESHAERVEIDFALLDDRDAAALKVADLERVDLGGVAEKIPAGRAAGLPADADLQIRAGNDFEAVLGKNVERRGRGAASGPRSRT